MKKHTDGIAICSPRNRNAWREWLEHNHESEHSVWLAYKKSADNKRNITYVEAVEEALCFGWIDSKPIKLNESTTLQYFSKRNPKSNWSGLNRKRVAKLTKENMMHPSGLRMVKLAKNSGTWTAFDKVEQLIIPEDLALAFKSAPDAFAHFDAFPKSVKKGILGWIHAARRAETREKRIRHTVQLAAGNERANQYVKK
jgi:uncharacterized protein YdeI (YjbR/CyaY-like superfamily)